MQLYLSEYSDDEKRDRWIKHDATFMSQADLPDFGFDREGARRAAAQVEDASRRNVLLHVTRSLYEEQREHRNEETDFRATISHDGVFTVTSGSIPSSGNFIQGTINYELRTFEVDTATGRTFRVVEERHDGPQSTPIHFRVVTEQAKFLADLLNVLQDEARRSDPATMSRIMRLRPPGVRQRFTPSEPVAMQAAAEDVAGGAIRRRTIGNYRASGERFAAQ